MPGQHAKHRYLVTCFFYKQSCFSTQSQYWLTFSQTELQMLLRFCLIYLSTAPHLPHLYHPATLWFFVGFSCVLGILVPRQLLFYYWLCLLLYWDACSEHSQTSKIELFSKIVNGFPPLTILTKSSILDVWLGSGYASESLCFILLIQTQLLNFHF